jgi:general secretion pathway protein F
MPSFRYTALTAAGRPVDGVATGRSTDSVIEQLQRQGLLPIAAEAAGNAVPAPPRWWLPRSAALPGSDLVLLSRQLSRLLTAGLPLDRALELIAELIHGRAGRAAVTATLLRVRDGAGLADAMAAQGAAFPRLFLAMVRAGERGGALAGVLERLADFVGRVEAVRQAVAAALLYPLILVVVATGSVGLVLTVVLPQFTPLFRDAGSRLPALTRIVMAAGDVVAAGWWAVPPALLGLTLLGRWAMRRPGFALAVDTRLLGLPLAGGLIARFEAARFARTLGALLANGVPAPEALPLAGEAVGNRALAAAVREATLRLRQGEGLSGPLAQGNRFPRLLIQLARVGEQTGALAALLGEAADLLDAEAQRRVDRLLALLVPALTIFMGLTVAVIVAAVLMAMISINDLAG